MDERIERLKRVAEGGDIDNLYMLIQEDAYLLEHIDQVPFFDTPLHIAASIGHIPFVLEMMRLKPSFARKSNPDGFSPIHLAIRNGQAQMVRQLLQVDGNLVRAKGREGMTPLHYAAAYDYLDLLAEFLSVCPHSIEDVTIRNMTALHIALKYNKLESFKLLVGWLGQNRSENSIVWERKVLNWKDEEGNTVLHVAAVSHVLAWTNADINIKNLEVTTTLQQDNNVATHTQTEREVVKSISEVGVEDLVKAGLGIEEANEFERVLKEAILSAGAKGSEPREVWREIVGRMVLKPWHPHELHQLVYYSVYANWDLSTNGPPLYWFPSLYQSKHSNLGCLMEKYGSKLLGTSYKDPITSFSLFQKFSVQHPEAYWSIVLRELSVSFHEAPNRVVEAAPYKAIVLPVIGNDVGIQLREQDLSWNDFLSSANHHLRSNHYIPIYQPVESVTNILFSSGTTGEPKAIPWTQISPIRCAADSWAHMDTQIGDVVCWPTNLGWVMEPILLYSCFLAGASATLALYHGSPLGRSFGKFVQVT
uniref:AMP-dependent synthetase/ligase domain-containing protein n=1 Tax=Fagus sylvatica TaxID=28930 RepID=A0A2N9GNX4_FAGSY